MASLGRNPLSVRHPAWLVLVSLSFFFLDDNLVFRSGFYDRFLNPGGAPNELYYTVSTEQKRAASPRRDVLILGSSTMNRAFSVKLFEQEHPESPFRFILAACAGTTEKTWYFELLNLDPHQDRYAAILLPTPGYKFQPESENKENDLNNANKVIPILKLSQLPEFLDSFSDPSVRLNVATRLLFSSRVYALDLQDFLLNPLARFKRLAQGKLDLAHSLYDWQGSEGSLQGADIDWVNRRVSIGTSGLTENGRRELESRLNEPDNDDRKRWTNRSESFRTQWLSKIVDLYIGKRTKIIFVPMPRWPFPMPSTLPTIQAADLRRTLPTSPNIDFLDEHLFDSLEEPRYFSDALHVNRDGRHVFTEKLGPSVSQILSPGQK